MTGYDIQMFTQVDITLRMPKFQWVWTGVLSLFLYNFFLYNFIKWALGFLKDENLKGREKAILAIFSVMKFFECCRLINGSTMTSIMSVSCLATSITSFASTRKKNAMLISKKNKLSEEFLGPLVCEP